MQRAGAARLDAEKFPAIRSANASGGSPFSTNSSQLPVQYSDDPFEVLDRQDELQTRCTGDTVVHLFAEEEITDPAGVAEGRSGGGCFGGRGVAGSMGIRFPALSGEHERLLEGRVELVPSRAIGPGVRPLVEAECIDVVESRHAG